jgi:large subunit ribosomal protein L24
MNIKKGDTVYIRTGKDRGKSGKVLSVNSEKMRLVVEGLNMFKKHKRPTKQGEKGQIISRAHSIAVSNLMLICSSCKKGSRIGFRQEGDKKVRICKRCGSTI